jgi:hypothetical protein
VPEWLIEKGIGETRAALVYGGGIIEARIELDGTLPAGTILEARLIDNGAGRNGTARDERGTDYLLPHVPREIPEGAKLHIEITRPALPGPEPWKRPVAKATEDPRRCPKSLAERLRECGAPVRKLAFPAPGDELGDAGWNDVLEEARGGEIGFAGGSLRIFPTPAMVLIDVDGTLPPDRLAAASARAAAEAVRRLDIGGSIGIDLPTVRGKPVRDAAAAAIDSVLPQPFERTAVNGFGFVQIVRPRPRASLVELAHDRAAFEARALLRRIGFETGARCVVANPAIIAVLDGNAGWLEELSRQIGGPVTLRTDASLPIHGAYAEKA